MTTAEQSFDVYEHAGPRWPFLCSPAWYMPVQELVHVLDFWRENMDEEVELSGEWTSDWEAARALWHAIKSCCHQAERMMALQPDYASSLAIYEIHLQNMHPLCVELRAAMLKCGVRFPEFQRAVPA